MSLEKEALFETQLKTFQKILYFMKVVTYIVKRDLLCLN